VILDPRLRISTDRRVHTDGEAETLVVCSADAAKDPSCGSGFNRETRHTEIIGIPTVGDDLDLRALVTTLHARGLTRLFVEGGGTTVSRFLEAGLLDRVQIAVAPLIMGGGRPGLQLPASERIAECLRPAHRIFAMGGDVLFDCDLRASVGDDRTGNAALARIY
jgi:riboflavin biosynthesis pyrimidine reductase